MAIVVMLIKGHSTTSSPPRSRRRCSPTSCRFASHHYGVWMCSCAVAMCFSATLRCQLCVFSRRKSTPPENERLEPENQLFGKDNHLPKPPFWGFQPLVFRSIFFCILLSSPLVWGAAQCGESGWLGRRFGGSPGQGGCFWGMTWRGNSLQ